ncbi:hypothetical protein Cni_G15119 [Canna indica]|uniref:protein-serine/threonine phosphatase n=1 Tax=Canna indica TaxID=4628 RepID=A0AAQ3KD81_9LILI|nr:hypothetical protein Cni_G15119 [Canna indica]
MGSCLSSSLSPATTDGTPMEGIESWRGRKKVRKDKTKRGRGEGSGGRRRAASDGGAEAVDDELHSVPGRMFLNSASEVACLYTQQGRKGTNQDAMIVWENFSLTKDAIFCGVFDGHGPYGHMVAKKVRDSLPLKLSTQWRARLNSPESPDLNGSVSGSMNSEETVSIVIDNNWGDYLDVDENEKVPEMYLPLKQSFLKAFKMMDKELKFHLAIDCFCSGTTAVTIIKQGQDLVIANIGDSRAIMGTRDKDNNLIAVQLTVDLKPNLPREAARIQQCKGRVFARQDEPEVARVWLPNNDSPGLAMARAFGDFCLKDYGLISVPEISYRRLAENDEFIVLATDGVWDALSNQEVVDIVVSAPTRSTAARAVVDCAVRSWRLKYPTSKIDDCATVCLFLNPESSSDSAQECDSDNKYTEPKEASVLGLADKEVISKRETPELITVGSPASASEPSNALHSAKEIVPVSDGSVPERSQSTRSLADCISVTEEEEWSALEGVTRVNSLLNLPRFLSAAGKGDRSSTTRKRWL